MPNAWMKTRVFVVCSSPSSCLNNRHRMLHRQDDLQAAAYAAQPQNFRQIAGFPGSVHVTVAICLSYWIRSWRGGRAFRCLVTSGVAGARPLTPRRPRLSVLHAEFDDQEAAAGWQPVPQVPQAEQMIRARGLWDRIDEVIWAVEGEPESPHATGDPARASIERPSHHGIGTRSGTRAHPAPRVHQELAQGAERPGRCTRSRGDPVDDPVALAAAAEALTQLAAVDTFGGGWNVTGPIWHRLQRGRGRRPDRHGRKDPPSVQRLLPETGACTPNLSFIDKVRTPM